ncbi:MAG: biliverdin-producing heme oxygenase [Donghicola eburneus]|nr:biliverdin-producing heme oxygenase [Donghicola eburneus]MCI5038611.1 biliverdin-producing heme oxygenase [Donghicola eburneus]
MKLPIGYDRTSEFGSQLPDQDLLKRLRAETHAVHEELDHLFTPFQDAPLDHLGSFLAAQMAGLTALSTAARVPHDENTLILLSETLDRLEQDCRYYELSVPVLRHKRDLHPLAVAYLVIGSRMGTEVLRRNLIKHGIERVPLYFTPQDYKHAWQDLCARLQGMESCGPEADDICTSVIAGFHLFQDAEKRTRDMTGKFS